MPLIFGEGDSAFCRLQKEMNEQSRTSAGAVRSLLHVPEYEDALDTIQMPLTGTCTWISQHDGYKRWYSETTIPSYGTQLLSVTANPQWQSTC